MGIDPMGTDPMGNDLAADAAAAPDTDIEVGQRIRTKVDRWPHPAAQHLRAALWAMQQGRADAAQTLDAVAAALDAARLAIALAAEIEEVVATASDMWLVRRHVGPCRSTMQLLHVADGEVHPPHHHHNLLSLQVVIRGRVHLREFDRIARCGPDSIRLRLASDRLLQPGDAFRSSEWHRNAHWFAAVGGPAVVFNFNARGYEPATFDADDAEAFGRRYLDPRALAPDGTVEAASLGRDEAEAVFGGCPPAGAPLPAGCAAPVEENPLRLRLV